MATLTLDEAVSVIHGARAKMDEMGVKLTISVVDGRGDLIALARVDGASWRTPYISQGKAGRIRHLGPLQRGHGSPLERANPCPDLWRSRAAASSPARALSPSTRTARLVGAAGGSGGTPQEDEDCVRAGIEGAGFATSA